MLSETLMHHRNLVSVLVKDLRRYRRALTGRSVSYLELCNRYERLEPAPDGKGYRCDWQWTSDLHAPKFLPVLGLRLMERSVADHPIARSSAPEKKTQQPDISFVIGHRGGDRLPHLLATLESIAAQRDVNLECIVVEQSNQPEIESMLPAWVRYIHTPLPHADMPYSRSWAFNVGARGAQGEVLVLHDNDMLVPVDYAKDVFDRYIDGYQVMNLKRFIFYLDEADSAILFTDKKPLTPRTPESIVQNLEAGGSFAITRRAYSQIGGMDESFMGWGGEDNEFWERAQTLKVWPFGYLPMIHLWHRPQSGKGTSERPTAKLYEDRSRIPVMKRIAELTSRGFGNMSGPTGLAASGGEGGLPFLRCVEKQLGS